MLKPDKFVVFVEQYIPMHRELREMLEPTDLDADVHGRRKRLQNTLRRLLRKGKVRKHGVDVPVLQGDGSGGRRIVWRPMSCYVPTNVLDKLAHC